MKIRLSLETILKAVIWELLGLLVIYLLTKSLAIGGIYIAIRIVMYYVFERVWKNSHDHLLKNNRAQKKI